MAKDLFKTHQMTVVLTIVAQGGVYRTGDAMGINHDTLANWLMRRKKPIESIRQRRWVAIIWTHLRDGFWTVRPNIDDVSAIITSTWLDAWRLWVIDLIRRGVDEVKENRCMDKNPENRDNARATMKDALDLVEILSEPLNPNKVLPPPLKRGHGAQKFKELF